MMFNPYVLLGEILSVLILVAAAYLYGQHNANAQCEVRVAKIYSDAADKAQAEKDAEASKANTASTRLETKAADAKVVFRTITRNVDRVVEKPVYQSVCFEADGLAIANAALAGVPVMLPTPAPAPLTTPMRVAAP